MPDQSALGKTEFLKSFDAALTALATNDDRVPAARRALDTLFENFYSEAVKHAKTATVFFADHGVDHGATLGEIVGDFLNAHAAKIPTDSPLKKLESVVMIFAALLFHDIGMSIPDGMHAFGLDEINRGQMARAGHDEKSLSYIEKDLLTAHIAEWETFWNTLHKQGWPTPCAEYAWRLVARICQSHSDKVDVWLTPEAIGSYRLVSKPTKVFKFANDWGPELWPEWEQVTLACASILNLADLCHIGRKRFSKPPAEWGSLIPADLEKRRNGFLHWAGHQVLEVEFAEDELVLKVFTSPDQTVSSRLATWVGPGADLLSWGSNPRLIACLRKFVSEEFKGIRVEEGARRADQWKDIEKWAQSDSFRDCWQYSQLNEALIAKGAETFDATIVLPSWWNALAHDWRNEIPVVKQGDIRGLRYLADLRSKGLLIEETIVASEFDKNKKIFFLSERSGNQKTASHDSLVNSFLGALRVARDLSVTFPETVWRVVVAVKGGRQYAKLKEGLVNNNALAEYQNTVILCPYLNTIETEEMKRIVRTISESQFNARMIIFGSFDDIERISEPTGARVQIDDASEKLSFLLYNQNNVHYDGDRLITNIEFDTRSRGMSVDSMRAASALKTLLFRASGADALRDEILSSLSKQDWLENRNGLSSVLYLSLVDMMNYSGKGVRRGDLNRMYYVIGRQMGPKLIEQFDLIHAQMMLSQMITGTNHLIIRGQDELTNIRDVSADQSAKATLIQIICLYKLQTIGHLINSRAVQFSKEPMCDATLASLIDYAMDVAQKKSERTYVGMYAAEHVRDHIQSGEIVIGNIIELLANRDKSVDSFEGVLLFQIAYLILKPRIDVICKEVLPLLKEKKAILCGYVEAIANSESTGETSIRKYKQIMAGVVQDISARLARGVRSRDLDAVLLFDILTKYAPHRSYLRDLMGVFSKDQYLDLYRIADHFHAVPSTRIEKRLTETLLFKRWQEMRNLLLQITGELSPPELRRNRVPEAVANRVGL